VNSVAGNAGATPPANTAKPGKAAPIPAAEPLPPTAKPLPPTAKPTKLR
jgi:hypothetical protein